MITNQAYLFLIFIINGLIIGCLFDFFRILRLSFKTKDFITYIEDIMFWVITGSIVLYSIFTFNNGQIRFYIFLGIFLGIILYISVFSKAIIKSSVFLIKKIKKIFSKIFNLIIIPFKFLRKTLIKPISFITINVKKRYKNLFNKFKLNLRQKKSKVLK